MTSLAVANAIIQSVARAAPRAAMMNIVHFPIGKLSSHYKGRTCAKTLLQETTRVRKAPIDPSRSNSDRHNSILRLSEEIKFNRERRP